MEAQALTSLGARAAAKAIAAREISPRELTAAHLERIEREDPQLNAFRTVMADEATAAAAEAERAVAASGGEPLGPLHGVPIAIKDNIEVRGVRMTAGTAVMGEHVAARDAFVVEKLRAAGAVILGKLHMSEWAIGGTTQNIHFGDAHNPWDLDRSAGGSSGGSGAAVAADLAPVTLGSDTGGSVRLPASLCGVTGLRPTSGRVSNGGSIPVSWTLDTIGPLARRAEDVARTLAVIAGFDAADPVCADRAVDRYEQALVRGAEGLRIGMLVGEARSALSGGVAPLLDAAAAAFADLGAELHPVELGGLAGVAEWTADVLLAEAAAYHEERLPGNAGRFAPDVLARLQRGAAVSGPHYARGRQEQRRFTRELLGLLDGLDLLLAPATPVPAPILAESDPLKTTGILSRYISIFGFARVPALVVPIGFTASEGLPVAMQLVGRHFDEAMLLRAAHAYQQATDWHLRRAGDRAGPAG